MTSSILEVIPHSAYEYEAISTQRYQRNLLRGQNHICINPVTLTTVQAKNTSIGVEAFTSLQTQLKDVQVLHKGVISADTNIYESLLRRHLEAKSVRGGKEVHAHMVRFGFEPDTYVTTLLITLYGKCGSLEDARHMFDKMSERNLVSWTAMITGYAQHGSGKEALLLFCQMQSAGEKPNPFTFGSVLCACTQIQALEEGKQVHACILKGLVKSNIIVLNALIDMYLKCRCIEDARKVFDKMPEQAIVSWNAMITGYAREGISREGLALFQLMETAGVKPNTFTFTSILSICSSLEALEHGKQVHACIVKSGLQSATSVGNALVDMYGKCGGLGEACRVFTRLPEQSVILWNSLISGYVKQGHCKEAFHIFEQMQGANTSPDQFTFATVLSVCADLALLDKGKQFHACIIKGRFGLNVVLGTALIDMYAKCGSIVDAWQVFDRMPQLDLISWNAMITGYAKHGNGRQALCLFKQMECTGMKPNHSTFIGILLGCSHSGLVDEGWYHFKSMSEDHDIMPRAEHYTCIVDLLGRAGCLDEAHELINNMPVEPDAAVWGALLGACSIHVNFVLICQCGNTN
jgi:pentatricopeptide repeat protein